MSHTLFPNLKPIGDAITPYNERKSALRQHRDHQTREAIEALRVHKGFGRRPNYVREAAFDRSGRV